jgi:hypothetical protein
VIVATELDIKLIHTSKTLPIIWKDEKNCTNFTKQI